MSSLAYLCSKLQAMGFWCSGRHDGGLGQLRSDAGASARPTPTPWPAASHVQAQAGQHRAALARSAPADRTVSRPRCRGWFNLGT